jgi:hypothetical protein
VNWPELLVPPRRSPSRPLPPPEDVVNSRRGQSSRLGSGVDATPVRIAIEHRPTPPRGQDSVQLRTLLGLQQFGEELGPPTTAQSVGDTADGPGDSRPLGQGSFHVLGAHSHRLFLSIALSVRRACWVWGGSGCFDITGVDHGAASFLPWRTAVPICDRLDRCVPVLRVQVQAGRAQERPTTRNLPAGLPGCRPARQRR